MDASTVPTLLQKGIEMDENEPTTDQPTIDEPTTEEAEPATPQPSWAEGNERNLAEREGTATPTEE